MTHDYHQQTERFFYFQFYTIFESKSFQIQTEMKDRTIIYPVENALKIIRHQVWQTEYIFFLFLEEIAIQ